MRCVLPLVAVVLILGSQPKPPLFYSAVGSSASEGDGSVTLCSYGQDMVWTYVELPIEYSDEIAQQWRKHVVEELGATSNNSECKRASPGDGERYRLKVSDRSWGHCYEGRCWTGRAVNWKPAVATPAFGTKLSRKTVAFANPGNIKKGFVNVTFDIEYQLTQCSGELHVAYSVIDDSVRQKKPGYYLEGRHYLLDKPAPSTITSVPIKGMVSEKATKKIIGRFADDHAAKALGFGCFSGQTKAIAKIADLGIGGSEKPSEEALAKFLKGVDVTFETPEVLTSTSVEAQIRAGSAKASAMSGNDMPPSDNSAQDDADLRAELRAQKEAEFQAKEKAYQDGLAAHSTALAEYEKALAETDAKKAAAAAQAKAVQEEFNRQRAAYEAEVARHAREQAEYEAKLRAMPK